jgi:hypothetical protein
LKIYNYKFYNNIYIVYLFYYIHSLCDKIELHHESKSHPKKKYTKFLYIYKPKIWLWEYTEKNPYLKGKEFYEKQKNQQRIKKN